MAPNVHQEIDGRRGISAHIGRQILDVITSGMYSDPRMALREYVQNAADSIDAAMRSGDGSVGDGSVTIKIDGKDRSIVVQDNGVGVKNSEAETRLGGLGCSSKIGNGYRGFRGIGRLGGLAYCDLLRFETRSASHERVAVVEWSGKVLREQVAGARGHEHIESAIKRIATLHFRQADKHSDPAHFFRVVMVNVHRFHSDVLMNMKGLREYLAQTVPVPYDRSVFSLADKIEKHLLEVPGYRSYRITVNGVPVVRPYRDQVVLRSENRDHISGIELLELKTADGRVLCRGWYAITQFMSAMPPHETMRGIRIRQGNIGVGDEDYLKGLFSEDRFTTWHIGELHVGHGLTLNARRDGFEESPEYELFLEWSTGVCRLLSSYCRQSSKERSAKQAQMHVCAVVESLLNNPFFLDENHKRATIAALELQLSRLKTMSTRGAPPVQLIATCETQIFTLGREGILLDDALDGRKIGPKDGKQVLSEVCRRILDLVPGTAGTALLREVVAPYAKGDRMAME